ncbi:hypothetical protein D9758_004953 [Tetrapyrgos nigripes]|uniref:Uncharacterized protein n=1 Tax=Tetrapyrgos nigripes TaxID=182062 RepID=A0A8H5LW15_9AGAR|nr:hypothetical protein D9758_004953 [Tetrapyrgos nigripes]
MQFTASLYQALSFIAFVGGVASTPMIATPYSSAQITRVVDFKGSSNTTAIETRTTDALGTVLVCIALNFAGCVLIQTVPNGICVPLGPDLNDFVSSFGPDAGQQCFIFADPGCTGDNRGPIEFPGVSDLSQSFLTSDGRLNPPFNDVTSSYQCFNNV